MRVIATAGHVDHGKSALVEALTGIHPDRLKEEQEREMTIDLGFAWTAACRAARWSASSTCPGHSDFIENMLAGVGGIDAALLVIAADEGVMPQTREHLAILDLLQVRAAVVALTKADLVDDPEWLSWSRRMCATLLARTALAGPPICPSRRARGAGLPELAAALDPLPGRAAAPPRSRPAAPARSTASSPWPASAPW